MQRKLRQKAPTITLPDQNGEKIPFLRFRGRRCVSVRYPKEDTQVCTKETCGIVDAFPVSEKLDAIVLVISIGSVESHKKFAIQYKLPYRQLADTNRNVVELCDIWGEIFMSENTCEKNYMDVMRVLFLIAPKGAIASIYPKVKPEEYAAEVSVDLRELTFS